MRHEHADLIIAWANGEQIQIYVSERGEWVDICNPIWLKSAKFRVKPEPKPGVCVEHYHATIYSVSPAVHFNRIPNLKLTFDVETCELKAAEVMR
jgi:hypothetical protein